MWVSIMIKNTNFDNFLFILTFKTIFDIILLEEDLIIDASKMYNIHPSKNSDKFDATTTQWVSPYTGFVITIGTDDVPHNHDTSN